tara:strand:- start:331 stop:540 length:210 start_codon:yes stop_codon:yes gene_type:complete
LLVGDLLLVQGKGIQLTPSAPLSPLYVSQVIDSQALCQPRDLECKTNQITIILQNIFFYGILKIENVSK